MLPGTLYGRIVLALAAALLMSQAASQLVNFFDRGSSLYRLNAEQMSQRIARTASLINKVHGEARQAVANELGARSDFRIRLTNQPIEIESGFIELDQYEKNFAADIRDAMNPPLLTTVEITRAARAETPDEVAPPSANAFENWLARRFYFMLPATFSVVAQIELEDGSSAVFFVRMPQEPLSRIEALLPQLLIWFVIILLMSLLVARMVTRSLRQINRAVERIASNPGSTEPVNIPTTGPIELRNLIASFNDAQERIRRYVIERSSLLAAISHDLRTPITRMRLRAELLPEAPREKFIHDLKEMEDLVGSSLDLFAELGKSRQRYPVDINALLDTIATDWGDTGHPITITGHAGSAYATEPAMLRRAINNLVSNGIRYGQRVEISVIDSPTLLRIRIRDHGPGIPEADRDRVFEPFVRLEPSRNRDSGGSGIGMAISRNIARWHNGDIHLSNAPTGGLIAEISLPRRPVNGRK